MGNCKLKLPEFEGKVVIKGRTAMKWLTDQITLISLALHIAGL